MHFIYVIFKTWYEVKQTYSVMQIILDLTEQIPFCNSKSWNTTGKETYLYPSKSLKHSFQLDYTVRFNKTKRLTVNRQQSKQTTTQ